MRHERFIPMEYAHEQLMSDWNEFNIALKIWLYPEGFGDKAPDLQRRYLKPTMQDLNDMFHKVYASLSKDAKPMIRY